MFKPGIWEIDADKDVLVYGDDAQSCCEFRLALQADQSVTSLDRAWLVPSSSQAPECYARP